MVLMASTNTLLQTMVPDHLRGRVMAMHVTMFMGMTPFGSLLAGAIAAKVGAPLAISIGAVLCLMGSGLFLLQLPTLRLVSHNPIRTHMGEPESM
jgi:MFS family permease